MQNGFYRTTLSSPAPATKVAFWLRTHVLKSHSLASRAVLQRTCCIHTRVRRSANSCLSWLVGGWQATVLLIRPQISKKKHATCLVPCFLALRSPSSSNSTTHFYPDRLINLPTRNTKREQRSPKTCSRLVVQFKNWIERVLVPCLSSWLLCVVRMQEQQRRGCVEQNPRPSTTPSMTPGWAAAQRPF